MHDQSFNQSHQKLPPEMNHQFTKPVEEEEIYRAIQYMNVDKAPCPNGLNVGFYKHNWKSIGKGVVKYVKHFLIIGV